MKNWFAYNGVGDPTSPGSYYITTIKPTCTAGGCMICAIYVDDDGPGTPGSLADVLDYIANAQVSLVAQPNGGAKRFVYVKNCR